MWALNIIMGKISFDQAEGILIGLDLYVYADLHQLLTTQRLPNTNLVVQAISHRVITDGTDENAVADSNSQFQSVR